MKRKSTVSIIAIRDCRFKQYCAFVAVSVGVVASFVFFGTAQAHAASRWSFATTTEDWGKTCFMTGKVGSNKSVGFYGSPGKHVVAFIDVGEVAFAEDFISSWTIDANPSRRLDGWLNEYFGFVDFKVPDLSILNAIASGSSLNIISTNIGNLTISLSGSKNAYAKFARCMIL